jgi:inosine-uridine nucleoside N-ribohydrolase
MSFNLIDEAVIAAESKSLATELEDAIRASEGTMSLAAIASNQSLATFLRTAPPINRRSR